MNTESHNAVVRREFTRQAPAYAANPVVANPDRVERLLAAIRPLPEARVLDVATGPGYAAMGFAACCEEVVGLDLTEAPLDLARREGERRGLTNLRLITGDAMQLPFEADTFDVVLCCLALHHMEDPHRILGEMARVCRIGGRVAIEDLAASDHPIRAAYQNEIEILRDPSHVRALSLHELVRLPAEVDMEVESVQTYTNTQQVERWLANAHTPEDWATKARALLARDEESDLSGLRPFKEAGELSFTHRMAVVVARKLGA
jgi:ubiquinone/menaquinone biosynthesis C-methylase UbiE